MSFHFLKTDPKWFGKAAMETKRFEIRADDRGFEVGDRVVLMEYDRASGEYTGNWTVGTVTCIVRAQDFPDGLKEGYCVLGLSYRVLYGRSMDEMLAHAEEQGVDPDGLVRQCRGTRGRGGAWSGGRPRSSWWTAPTWRGS